MCKSSFIWVSYEKPSSSYCVMLNFWWGCRGNLITSGNKRINNTAHSCMRIAQFRPSVVRDMAFLSCRVVRKRLLLVVPCIACLVMVAIDFTGKRGNGPDEGKAESTKPIIHNMYVVCDPQNLCDFSPCRNGGTCHPTESDGTKSFRCSCAYGFSGETCVDSKYLNALFSQAQSPKPRYMNV